MTVGKGKEGLLPVEMTREVTWDSVTWTVVDRSETELLKHSCEKQCGEDLKMFSFKVDVAGKHNYLVEVEKEGVVLTCSNVLVTSGIWTIKLLNFNQVENRDLVEVITDLEY